MSIKKRLLSAALALALGASLLTGCSKGADGSGSQSSSGDSSSDVQAMDLTDVTDPYLATAGIAGDTVVGTVGDYEVTADSLLYWLNYNISYTKQQYSAYGISDMRWDETSEDGTTTAQALLKTAMQLASFYRLLPELAAKEGLSVPQETIDGLTLESTLGTDSPEEGMVEKIALREAIDSLPERERITILLRFFRGMTQEQTARILKVSQVQVSRLERKGLAKLREILEA